MVFFKLPYIAVTAALTLGAFVGLGTAATAHPEPTRSGPPPAASHGKPSEGSFYKTVKPAHRVTKNLRIDYGVNGVGNSTDSSKLQQAIDDVAAAGGGAINVPAGTYEFGGIALKSNVHLMIDHGAEVLPYKTDTSKSIAIFTLDGGISNVSIQGVGGRFQVQLASYDPGVRVVQLQDVQNFYLAEFSVRDALTKYSAVTLGAGSTEPSGNTWPAAATSLHLDPHSPTNGVVKNIDLAGGNDGYGVVQTQAARHVLFENLASEGGVTLRVETGWSVMNDAQIGGVDEIYGRDLSCTNGNAAVSISPHEMYNGSVNIDGATSRGCRYTVKIASGFLSAKAKNPNLTLGSFTNVSIHNVDATFGTMAQLKEKKGDVTPYDFVPVYREKFEQSALAQPGSPPVHRGPSIAAVFSAGTSYASNVHISDVTLHGFLCQKGVITLADKHPTLDCSPSQMN